MQNFSKLLGHLIPQPLILNFLFSVLFAQSVMYHPKQKRIKDSPENVLINIPG